MGFYGTSFIFDGVPSEEYGMMIYDVGSSKQDETAFVSSKFIEDRISRRYDPLFYGQTYNDPLEFKLTFGLHPELIDQGKHFDRYDFERIASWLTGRNGYKWLTICGEDADYVRYKCQITELEIVEGGVYPQVFTCKVSCDSPFGYTREMVFNYVCTDTLSPILHSRSTYNGFYYPKMTIALNGASEISVTNQSDGGRIFSFSGIPAAFQNAILTIDCLNQTIVSSTGDNMYPYCNKRFFRLIRGDNNLSISGNCTVTFNCSFPINVGG
jgi:phage-related protein